MLFPSTTSFTETHFHLCCLSSMSICTRFRSCIHVTTCTLTDQIERYWGTCISIYGCLTLLEKKYKLSSTTNSTDVDFWVELRLALANSHAVKSLVQNLRHTAKDSQTVLLNNNFFLSDLRGLLTVCPNTRSNGWMPETAVLPRE